MKFTLHIDPHREEEVLVYAHRESRLTDALRQQVTADSLELIGYKDREGYRLELRQIHCFTVEAGHLYAHTAEDRLLLRCRLYQLEEQLPDSFVKLNQSCLANLRAIRRFDASIAGTLTVTFANGYTDYVSRRQLKTVKERLGI